MQADPQPRSCSFERWPKDVILALIRLAGGCALASGNARTIDLHHRPKHFANIDRPAGVRARRARNGDSVSHRDGADDARKFVHRRIRARVVFAGITVCLHAYVDAAGVFGDHCAGAVLRVHHHCVRRRRRISQLRLSVSRSARPTHAYPAAFADGGLRRQRQAGWHIAM